MKESLQKAAVAGKWLAVVVVAAGVGSAATILAVKPEMNNGLSGGQSAVTASAVPTTMVKSETVSDSVTEIVKKDSPAVFAVVNTQQMSQTPWGGMEQSQGQGSSGSDQQGSQSDESVGTGVLIKKDSSYGYIVTNNHVVEGASKLEAVASSGQHISVKLVGTDPYTDLAVIKIPVQYVKNVTPIQLANSNDIQAGEPVVAIGTPEGLDFQDSVTSGIVSGKSRTMPVEDEQTQDVLDYQPVIQTDAAINPGNSGGPLLDMTGRMIGVNSSKIVDPTVQGMGFSIPSNEVATIAQQIMKSGHAEHPALGISGYDLQEVPDQYWGNAPVNYGVYVQSVTSSNAKAAGLKAGDIIVGINNHTVQTMADLRTYLFGFQPGQSVTLNVYQGQQKKTITVQLGSSS
jgi:serine protease Do